MKRILRSLAERNGVLAGVALGVLTLLVGAVPAAGATLDGTWTTTTGRFGALVLHERTGGRLVGYLPGDPATIVTGGVHAGSAVTINFTTSDPGITRSGAFTGALAGRTLSGTLDDGGGPEPITLERTARHFAVEHWILTEGTRNDEVRARRVLTPSGGFATGGFVGLDDCGFLSCGGNITAWDISGTTHMIATASGGSCPSISNLAGTWDPSFMLLSGGYTTTTCAGGSSGTFLGPKEGLTNAGDIRRVLELLGQFADLIEAESPAAADAFASFYLQDGTTKADWQTRLAALYAAYDNLEARIDGVRQITSYNDAEVHPIVAAPPRVEWRLIVTGIPAGGGARVTVLDMTNALGLDESLFWLGEERGTAFVGNGYTQRLSIGMPVLSGDAMLETTGLWPFGVHGGGHPEGHPGWDLEYTTGAKVRAAADGVVSFMMPNMQHPELHLTSVFVRHRPGYSTLYDHIAVLEPGIVVGAAVHAGDPIGTPGSPSSALIDHNHFDLWLGLTPTCPLDYLHAVGRAVFDAIWSTARYQEELAEPLPCNPIAATFPMTRAWLRTSGGLLVGGSLVDRIEFIRLDPTTSAYDYRLLDAGGSVIESGTVDLNPFVFPFSTIDLQPAGGPRHLGIYDILSGTLRIAWGDAARPADLTGASEYSSAP